MSENEPLEGKIVSPWPRMIPVLCVLGGFILGAVAMMVQGYGSAPKAKTPDLALNRPSVAGPLGQAPNLSEPEAGVKPGENPTGEEPTDQTQGTPNGEIPPADPSTLNPDPGVAPGAGTNPTTPPGGTPPPPLAGALPEGPILGGNAPLKPIVIEPEKEPVILADYTEYLSIVPEKDVEPTLRQVETLARSAGGQVQMEFEHDPDRPELGKDVIIAVPKENAAKLKEALLKSASAQEGDTWSGPISERQFRMERFLREARGTLEVRLTRLKVRYHEDAPAVVRTAETIARIQNALKAFRRIPAEKEAIRVFVGRPNTNWP